MKAVGLTRYRPITDPESLKANEVCFSGSIGGLGRNCENHLVDERNAGEKTSLLELCLNHRPGP